MPIVGDVKAVIGELIAALRRDGTSLTMDNWWEYLRGGAGDLPAELRTAERRQPVPGVRHRDTGQDAGPEAVYVAGVGQHQMWAAQFISYENPKTWLNSGGLGTMGFAVPAAMGAKFGRRRPRCGRSTATAASR